MTIEKLAKIRTTILGLLPHGYVLHRESKRKNFIQTLQNLQKGKRLEIPKEISKFDSVISVQGFGYSGSGAVLDLLREYPVEVLGFVDTMQGSKVEAKASISEIEIMRLAGGFFEMEKYLDCENIFLNTAMLNRMVRLFETSALYNYSEEIKMYMVSFFDSLLDFSMLNLSLTYYNPYLTRYDEKSSIFFLKKYTLEEFRSRCSNLLNVIFNRINTTKKMLAVDQLCADYELDIKRNSQYVKNLKTILVTRDPRDLYVWAKSIDCEWIAHDTVENFIRWYSATYKNVHFEPDIDEYLVVRYEDLIWKYEKTVDRIEKYLNLKPEDHVSIKSCFDPSLSSKYTKLYKIHQEYFKDIENIESNLRAYCSVVID